MTPRNAADLRVRIDRALAKMGLRRACAWEPGRSVTLTVGGIAYTLHTTEA